MEVEMMLDLMSRVDPSKLLPLINFKNTLMNQKPKFRRMLRPEFLEFQEFRKHHLKLCLLLGLKLLRLSHSQKTIQLIQMKMRTWMPKLWQLQLLKLFLQLLHIQQLRFFRTNTNNFQLSMKTLLNKIKQWKKKQMSLEMKQKSKQKF